ncbi:unnamed protein product [Urochloa humidicola]
MEQDAEQDAQEVLVHPAQPPVGNAFLELNDLMQQQEQVIAEDVDAADEQLGDILAPIQDNQAEVQVHLLEVHENFLVDEFPADMLMDGPADLAQHPHPEPEHVDNIHLGIVQTFSAFSADPGWEHLMASKQAASHKANATATRLWAKHFAAPGQETQQADISPPWADFFTLLLLSPSHFHWAKDMIASQAWNFFLSKEKIQFFIPKNCPQDSVALQLLEHASPHIHAGQPENKLIKFQEIEQSTSIIKSPDNTPKVAATDKKGKAPQAIVDSEVRRSPRMKNLKKVIRNLGAAFCKLEADKLATSALKAKRKAGNIKRQDGCSTMTATSHKDRTKQTAPLKKPVKPKKNVVPNDKTATDQCKKPRQQ